MVANCPSRACARNIPCRRMGGCVVVLTLLVAGCATTHDQLTAFVRSHEVDVATGQYVARPPDGLAIHAPGAPEIDGAHPTIRPDGKVALRLLGEVDVAGLTTEEIAAKLKTQLSRYYVDPDVVVELAGQRSQYYYVFGEVANAGPRPFSGRDSLLKTLAESQPTFLAWRSHIRILRPSPDQDERKTIIVDLDRMVEQGDSTNDILLQPGDVVYVPPTPLAWVGLRVRELLYPVGPLMNAYTTPLGGMASTHAYEDEFGDDEQDKNRTQRYIRLR